jgi:UDP-N-acetyl-D-mannosaminuronic acid transferase (WecB/TagA/CpsF family)
VKIRILGIDFCTDGPAIPARLSEGGLLVAPSGPGLACDLPTNDAYRRALCAADWVIPDSGLMVLVWNGLRLFAGGASLKRYSGLRLLREVLPLPEVRKAGASFWIMPSRDEQERNLRWLRENGFPKLSEDDCYLAPLYRTNPDGSVHDEALLAIIESRRPQIIFVNVGGGVQEQLGWYLQKTLSYKPAILCTGAAIAFLTGGQAEIPPWADRLYLGWLLRILQNPAKFGRRYWASTRLIWEMIRFRDRLPVSES